jgi:RecB family exonuclease
MILEELYTSLYEEYNKVRDGIHVSDITLCPREACFRRLDPKPLTNTDLNFFTSGKAIHEALQSLIKKYPDRFELEKEVKFGDIVGHIDIFDKTNHIPIEAKSARVKTMEEPKAHYLKQLEAYMALTNADTGIILVQCLLNYEDKPFLEFEHKMTAEQRKAVLSQLQTDAIMLKVGILEQDPSLVRHINYDLTLNWKCRYCPYAKPCEEMRIEANASNFNKQQEEDKK